MYILKISGSEPQEQKFKNLESLITFLKESHPQTYFTITYEKESISMVERLSNFIKKNKIRKDAVAQALEISATYLSGILNKKITIKPKSKNFQKIKNFLEKYEHQSFVILNSNNSNNSNSNNSNS